MASMRPQQFAEEDEAAVALMLLAQSASMRPQQFAEEDRRAGRTNRKHSKASMRPQQFAEEDLLEMNMYGVWIVRFNEASAVR